MAESGFAAPDVPSDAIVNTCIKCGFCLPTCPTYQLTLDERSSPRGRIELIARVLDGRLPPDDATFTAQMSECLGCRNCEPACPSGVRYGSLLEDARAQIARRRAADAGVLAQRAIYDALFGDVRLLRSLARALGAMRRTGLPAVLRASGVIDALGLGRLDRLVRGPLGSPFVPIGQSWFATAPRKGSVALFAGCVMSAMFGDVDRATVRVLSRSGWDVEAPAGQGCCGALHLHAGFKDKARELARSTIAAFDRSRADRVAVNAAGCGAAMKEYAQLLEDDPQCRDRARTFAAKVCDATELVAGSADARTESDGRAGGAPTGSTPLRVAYQDACHLAHAQGVRTQPRRAIDLLPGVARVEFAQPDRCCGSAGIYNITHPETADALADKTIAAVKEVGAERLVTANPGCQLQLAAASRRAGGPPVQHIMSLLDDPSARPAEDDDCAHAAFKGLAFLIGATVIVGVLIVASRRKR